MIILCPNLKSIMFLSLQELILATRMLPILIFATAGHLLVTTNYNVDGALTVGYEPNELHYATGLAQILAHFLHEHVLFNFELRNTRLHSAHIRDLGYKKYIYTYLSVHT